MNFFKRNFFVSISLQISIFLVIVAFIPIAIMMALKTYEKQQLNMLENSNVQQGRIVASAIITNNQKYIEPEFANSIIVNMNEEFDSRIRILDKNGKLISDSSKTVLESEVGSASGDVEYHQRAGVNSEKEPFVYKVFSFPIRVYRKFFKPPKADKNYDNADFYTGQTVFTGEEVIQALNGKYGAKTRISAGGQVSVTLYSAIPIKNEEEVLGVVLVNRSTYKILQNLYELRIDLGKVLVYSFIVVIFISLFLAFRISYPLKKLSKQAVACADKKGRVLFTDFTGKKRHDEIGELSNSFSSLIERLNKRIKFSQAFSSDISHEFKNPLTAIRTSSELLSEKNLSDKERLELSNAIIDEVSHLQQLLSEVRNISKIDAGVLESEDENKFPVNEYTKNIIIRLRKNYPDVKIDFNSDFDEALLAVPQSYYDRIAENLIDNAMSFGQKVLVTTNIFMEKTKSKKYEKKFMLCVEDNGKGIDENQLKKIFNRFYSERSQEQSLNHTGLGLAIVKAISDSLDGELSVRKSTTLGGASFTFVISI